MLPGDWVTTRWPRSAVQWPVPSAWQHSRCDRWPDACCEVGGRVVRGFTARRRRSMTEVHDTAKSQWHTQRVSASRTQWLEADLRCLMCGRVVGHLVGPLRLVNSAGMRSERTVRFAAFRPADSSFPALRLIGGEQFRCMTCGGSVIVDQLERFSTYIDVGERTSRLPEARAPRPHRGAPARYRQRG